MSDFEEERLIKRTSGDWKAKLSTDQEWGQLKLTNKQLTIGSPSNSIPLSDIYEVEFDTRFISTTRIKLDCRDGTKYLELTKLTAGDTYHLLTGVADKPFFELASYTGYWAALITIAVFLYGSEVGDDSYTGKTRVWCRGCMKYVEVDSRLNLKETVCPVCGEKGVLIFFSYVRPCVLDLGINPRVYPIRIPSSNICS